MVRVFLCFLEFTLTIGFPGHCFCSNCAERLLEENPFCPSCRRPLARKALRRIFIEVAESKVTVVEGLNKMDSTTGLPSVKKAEEKLRKEVGNYSGEKAVDMYPKKW